MSDGLSLSGPLNNPWAPCLPHQNGGLERGGAGLFRCPSLSLSLSRAAVGVLGPASGHPFGSGSSDRPLRPGGGETERAGCAERCAFPRRRLRRRRTRVRTAAPCGGFKSRPLPTHNTAPGPKRAGCCVDGEGGIRTRGEICTPRRFSKAVPSAARSPLQVLSGALRAPIREPPGGAGCRRLDSNQRPRAYESLALPTELRRPGPGGYAGASPGAIRGGRGVRPRRSRGREAAGRDAYAARRRVIVQR